MPRQLPPTHLRVPSAPSVPQRFHTAATETVVVNHYNTEKLIPTIPGFRTSAGMFFSLVVVIYFFFPGDVFGSELARIDSTPNRLLEYSYTVYKY